jgi:hypothetical protein
VSKLIINLAKLLFSVKTKDLQLNAFAKSQFFQDLVEILFYLDELIQQETIPTKAAAIATDTTIVVAVAADTTIATATMVAATAVAVAITTAATIITATVLTNSAAIAATTLKTATT